MESNGIGWAVKQLQDGLKVTRRGWNGPGQYLELVEPGFTWLPYVVIRTVQGKYVPWLCSQTDLLAMDWEVVQ